MSGWLDGWTVTARVLRGRTPWYAVHDRRTTPITRLEVEYLDQI